jgi:amphi-Trp domain-containing protein
MSSSKIKEHVTRAAAANKLAKLADELRNGSVSFRGSPLVSVTDEVDLKGELEDDELKLEIKWKPLKM